MNDRIFTHTHFVLITKEDIFLNHNLSRYADIHKPYFS